MIYHLPQNTERTASCPSVRRPVHSISSRSFLLLSFCVLCLWNRPHHHLVFFHLVVIFSPLLFLSSIFYSSPKKMCATEKRTTIDFWLILNSGVSEMICNCPAVELPFKFTCRVLWRYSRCSQSVRRWCDSGDENIKKKEQFRLHAYWWVTSSLSWWKCVFGPSRDLAIILTFGHYFFIRR